MKTEAEFQMAFSSWLRSEDGKIWMRKADHKAAAFELKFVKCPGFVRRKAGDVECKLNACRKRLPFSAVSEGQIEALVRVAGLSEDGEPLVYKISDMALGYKPFDCFAMSGCGAYVVVGWRCGTGRIEGRVKAYALTVDCWLGLVGSGAKQKRGSLSEGEVRRLGCVLMS